MTSKDEILANFQVCSGIDDVGEAFTRLEAANWNLVEAVNAILEVGQNRAASLNFAGSDPVEVISIDGPDTLAVPPVVPPTAAAGGVASASAESEDMLHLNIEVIVGGITGSGEFPLEMPQATTGAELKTYLYQLLGVVPCKQTLCCEGGEAVRDDALLTPQILGPNNRLTLNTASEAAAFTPYKTAGKSSSIEVMDISGGDEAGAALQRPSASHSASDDVMVLPSPSLVEGASSSSHSSPLTSPSLPTTSRTAGTTYTPINNRRDLRKSARAAAVAASNDSFPSIESTSNSSKNISSLSKLDFPSSSSFNNVDVGGSTSSASNKSSSSSFLIPSSSNKPSDSNTPMFIFHIKDTTHSTDYTLHFPGSRTVGGVKLDLADVTSIPVHRQQWTGWPSGVTDFTTLSMSGIITAKHYTVCLAPSTASASADKKPSSKSAVSSLARAAELLHTGDSSDDEEFEELIQDEDDTFLEEMMDSAPVADTKSKSLLPNRRMMGEQDSVDHFCREFNLRYGSLAPLFFQGPLKEAMDMSINLPPAQRRLLGLYVHHDGSVLANVFCSQVLCQATAVSFLADNFVLWGWDVTHFTQKEKLITNVSGNIGPAAGLSIRNFRSEQLPAIMVLTKSRGNCEVLSVIYASTSSLNEVVTGLMEAVEVFEDTRNAEVAEDQERQSRQAIMNHQDAEYQESLRADRAKAELKRQQEEDEQRETQRKETIRLHEQEMTEKLRATLESELPLEPQDTDSGDVTVMRFRPPGAEPFKRAFKLDTALQVVLNFLHVRGFPADAFKFLQSWPRRDLASLNVSRTLKDYTIPQQETITIEER